eukprot:1196286-Prorocentrum_minimum.AAC.4
MVYLHPTHTHNSQGERTSTQVGISATGIFSTLPRLVPATGVCSFRPSASSIRCAHRLVPGDGDGDGAELGVEGLRGGHDRHRVGDVVDEDERRVVLAHLAGHVGGEHALLVRGERQRVLVKLARERRRRPAGDVHVRQGETLDEVLAEGDSNGDGGDVGVEVDAGPARAHRRRRPGGVVHKRERVGGNHRVGGQVRHRAVVHAQL